MFKKIGIFIVCFLFITCEQPLVETNPLHGLELECIDVSQSSPGSSVIMEFSIKTGAEILDYGPCVKLNGDAADIDDIQHSIQEFESFWTDFYSWGELNTDGEVEFFYPAFNLNADTEYLFASYAKVLINEEVVIVYSNGIVQTTLWEDSGGGNSTSYNCVNSICTYVPNSSGTYDTLAECLNSGCQDTGPSGSSYNCVNSICTYVPNSSGTYETLTDCLDSGCQDTEGCEDDEVESCNNDGSCWPASWIGNGTCNPPLDCAQYDYDGGDCIVYGCTYTNACNYNSNATDNDGSCEYPGDPCQVGGVTGEWNSNCDCIEDIGCTNYQITTTTQAYGYDISWELQNCTGTIYAQGSGYNSYGTYYTSVCLPEGAYVFILEDSVGDTWNGATIEIDPLVFEMTNQSQQHEYFYIADYAGCGFPIFGCTDPTATNSVWDMGYTGNYFQEDGTCNYNTTIYGCTDPNANNYNPDATINDGSCTYGIDCNSSYYTAYPYTWSLDCNGNGCIPDEFCGNGICNTGFYQILFEDGSLFPQEDGSTPYLSLNCPDWNYDCGDCTVYGCTDPNASNYNSSATVDDGSCYYGTNCADDEIEDCDGNCAPSIWVGDGYCDEYNYNWGGVPINLNCYQFNYDGGDCAGGMPSNMKMPSKSTSYSPKTIHEGGNGNNFKIPILNKSILNEEKRKKKKSEYLNRTKFKLETKKNKLNPSK